MASVAKFKQADTPRLFTHCNRTQKNQGTHIDKNRTDLNYNLADRGAPEMTDYQYMKARLHQDNVKMLNRKDVNAVCSWVITYPKDMCHEVTDRNGEAHYEPNNQVECRQFFGYAYDFLAKQHGKENVISAYVHMDENMPHIHFIFTPIVQDKKHGGYKVSAKEALQDCYGAKFQVRLQDYISDRMGKELHMVKKENVDYERNVRQLKKQTLNAKVASLNWQIKKAQEELDRKKRSIRTLDRSLDTQVNIKATSTNGYTVIKDADWQQIQEQLKAIKALRIERSAIKEELNELEKTNFVKEKKLLEKENEQLRSTMEDISAQSDNLRLEVLGMQEFLDTIQIDGVSALDLYRQQKEEIERENELTK